MHPHCRNRRGLLTTLLAMSAGLSLAPVVASAALGSTPVNAGYRDFSYGTVGNSTPTGEKPQSLLWWNDGSWWGVLWDAGAVAYAVHKFDVATQSWASTGTVVDSRTSAKGDVLWDGQRLYVATYTYSSSAGAVTPSNAGRLYRFSYAPATDTYTLDPGFPVLVNGSKSETLVLDKDSSGKLWVTWVEAGKVKINRSIGDDLTWGVPFDLPAQSTDTNSDDISSVIAMGGKIGVMWSDQNARAMYFATHIDGRSDTDWEAREPALVDAQLGAVADDHIHLAWAPDDGALYAATKTSLSSSNPLVFVLKRTASGSWSRGTYGTGSENHTRPTMVVNPDADSVYVFAQSDDTGRQVIYRKSASTGNLLFPPGLGTPVIDSPQDLSTNNPTTTKQSVNGTTGILVAASDQNTHYYLHHHQSLGPVTNAPPVIASFTPSSGPVGTVVTILGSGFTGTTSVTFGTVAASFSVQDDARIQATVPVGATTGRIRVTDGQGSSESTASFTVTTVQDRAPVVVAPASAGGPEGSTLTVQVTASDPDGQVITSLTADLTQLPSGNNAVFTASLDQATGVLTWTPATDHAGSYSVTFRAQNALVGTSTTTIVITNLDRAPIVSAPSSVKVRAGVQLTVQVSASDPDGDPIASLTADLSKLPAGHSATFSAGPGNTSGTFTWTPATTVNGTFPVTFTARNVLTATRQTSIHVQRARRADAEESPDLESFPAVVSLSPAWPNPSSGSVAFALELPADARVEWGVWDAQGRRAHAQTVDLGAGRHALRWTGVSETGAPARPGIYFVRVRAGGEQFTRRFIRL